MPHDHYLEVTNLLMKVASDDINRAAEIRTLIKVNIYNHPVIDVAEPFPL